MIGATTSTTLDLTLLNNSDTIYSVNQIKVEIGLKIGDKIEYIPMGYYNIDDVEKTDYTIKITAFDNMIKFETPYFSSLGNSCTLQQVVNELVSKTGVKFIGSLPSYNVKKLEGFTCREILSYVASVCGGNATITRDGNFTIVYPKEINYSITADNYFEYKREEVKYKIGKVSCQVKEKEIISKGSLGTDSMELLFENPWVNETILTDIYDRLNKFEYLGYSLKWQGDISVDVGDIISCTDTKGIVRKIPILSQKFTYTGGLTSEISAKGESKNKNSFSSSGGTVNKVNRLVTEVALVNKAFINYAHINDAEIRNLKVESAKIKTAEIEIANINNILAGNIGAGFTQTIYLTAKNVVLDNTVIKELIAKEISANDLKSSNISTNKFKIVSDNGKMFIWDNTIQIRDNNRTRVQIGKDSINDYNMYIWDSTGRLMFDATGLKSDGIKSKIIRDDMVSDNANINGSKLNIHSVVTNINNGTTLLKSSKINIDTLNQTLEVAFSSLKSKTDGIKTKTESNSTAIGVIKGQISTLIKNTTITDNGSNVKLQDFYSIFKQTSKEIDLKVSSLETIKIGAVNRALDTKTIRVSNKLTGGINQTHGMYKVLTSGLELGNVTVSFDFEYTNLVGVTGKLPSLSIQGVGNVTSWNLGAFNPNNFIRKLILGSAETKKIKIIYSFKITENHLKNEYWTTNIRADYLLSGNFKVSNFKVEKGDKVTGWTQAPEDIDNNIANLSSRVATAEQKLEPGRITQSISEAINCGKASIYTVTTILDKTGFTIKNGAIKIQNRAGKSVLTGDTKGNLTLKGSIESTNDTGEIGIKINYGSMTFTTWGNTNKVEEVGTILSTSFPKDRNQNGISIATSGQGDYISIGHKKKDGSIDNSMLFFGNDYAGSGHPYTKKGIYIHETLYIKRNVQFSEAGFEIKTKSGVLHQIFNGDNDLLAIYGDNGIRLGSRIGDSNRVALWIRERTDGRYGQEIELFTDLKCNGYNVYGANEVNSDLRLKHNITYLNDETMLTSTDMYNFIKDELKPTTFYMNPPKGSNIQGRAKIGFIAQDIQNTKIGQYLIGYDPDGYLCYDVGSRIGVVENALKVAINKIEALEREIKNLKDKGVV
ncbi:tail fiber domain-containing protein [Clostridium septicum]|uniref:tail fiber domain-containing protein n=1 Tax=Clostridium septicum TaxID=1504 RepID=UPI0040437DAF